MVYLYRFDILPRDGVLSDPFGPFQGSLGNLANAGRQVFYCTNFEEPVPVTVADRALTPGLLQLADAPSVLVFQPTVAISHSGLRLDDEKAAGELTVRLHHLHPVAQVYAQAETAAQTWLTVAEISTPLDPAPPRVLWTGRVRTATFDETMCTLTCMHLGDILQRPGLTRKHDRLCPYALGDQSSCRVRLDDVLSPYAYFKYREDGFLASVSADGLTVVVPEAANRANGTFAEGILVVDAAVGSSHYPRATYTGALPSDKRIAGGIRRTVSKHTGGTLTLKTRLPGTHAAGVRAWLVAGCDGLPATCAGRFNNYANYGGYPLIPLKNIFQTGLK